MKRILSVLLVLAMLVSYVPTYAVAEETTVEDASAVSADEVEKPEAETVADRVEPDETEATDATEIASKATEEATETIPESTTGISETIGTSPTEEKNADKSFVFLNADFQEEDQTYHYTVEANVGDIVVLCADLEYNGEKPLQYQWMRFDIDRNAYIDISLEENEDARSEKLTVNVTEAMIEMEAPYACKVTLDQTEELAVFSIVPLEATGDDTLVDEIFALDAVPDSSDEGWLWPVPDNRTIYSPFNLGNDYLINKRGSTHWGIDIARNADLSIVASRTGVVAFVQNSGYNDTSGKNQSASTCRLVLQHNINGKTFFSYYLHIKSGTIRYYSNINGHKAGDVISVGDTIPQGTVIGITGNTGLAYGTHLHFGLSTKHSGGWVSNGTYINPNPTNSGVITSNNKGQYSNTDILGYSSNYGDGIEYVIPGSTVTAPAAPTNFKAVYVDNARAKLSWSASSGATSYEVQYWSVGSNAWKTDTSYSSGTSYTSTGLKNYSSWTFRVRAVNSAGKSDWVSCNYEKTHTHSYKQEFEAAHPHKVYMKCSSCGDWYYTGATTTVDSCTQCHPPVQQVYLDLKGYLDGRDSDSLENFGTCDVYINDVKVADDCTDFYRAYPVGTKYSIKDIRATDGHKYIGEKPFVDEDGNTSIRFEDDDGTISGTLKKNTEVVLEFETTSHGGKCGDNLTWTLDGNGTLTISGTGAMEDYQRDGTTFSSAPPWYANREKISKVVIQAGVTSIGDHAFDQCSNLASVTIPKGVTNIGKFTFYECSSLTSVTIPKGVMSIGMGVFDGCTSLSSVTIPEGVTSIGISAFVGCSGLTSITLPVSVTSIGGGAFAGCTGLTSIIIPEGVTSIGEGAFSGCSSLTGVIIPEGVTEIEEDTFRMCSSLTSITLPESMTAIGDYAFWDCTGLTSITIPAAVTSIGQSAFFGCTSLTGITLPAGLTSIGDSAFWECTSLTSTTIPAGVTSIGEKAFQYCAGLTSVTISAGVTSIGERAFSDCSSLTSVIIPVSVTRIGEDAFCLCIKLKNIYYGGTKSDWESIENHDKDSLKTATIHYQIQSISEIRPVDASTLDGGATLKLTLWSIDQDKQIGAAWSLAEGSEAYASITASGTLTAKAVIEPVEITVIAQPTNGEPTATKTIRITPKATALLLMRDGEVLGETLNADMYDLQALTLTAIKNTMEEAQGIHWSTSAKTVAQVDAKGLVTLLKPGTAVIQATDSGKLTGKVTLNVTYTDKSPRLEATTLNLNTALSGGVTVDFVEAYGNGVEALQWNDERFLFEYQENRLMVSAKDALKNGTYPVSLTAACSDGRTYAYPLTLKVTNTLPKVTVKQTAKLNLFYRDSESTLTITGGEVESAAFIGNSDFALENEDDQWFIRYADPENIPAKPSTKATLSVLFAGYNTPVTKSVTIATVNTSPKLKLSPSSSVLNTVLTEALEVRAQLAGTDDDNLSVWTDTPGAEVYLDDGTLTIELSAAKAVTVNVYVQSDSWAKPVKLTHKVSVTSKKPTLKAINSTLKLNSYFPSETASTGLILSQGNLSLSMVELTSTAKAGAAATESEKLSVSYDLDSEEIVAEILDSSIKNGTYSFTCVGTLEDGTAISGGTVKVSVTNTLPKAKLSASTVKLNKRLTGEEATVKVSLTGGNGYTVTGFENLPDFMWYEDGILTVTLPEQSGTYPLYATVSRGGEEAVLPTAVKLTVQVYDKVPSFRLSAKGKLDVLNPDSEIIYTPKLTNALGTATDVELTGASADLFDAEVVNGTIHLTLAKSGDNYSTKATYKIVPLLTICDQQVKGPALSIKVTQSALKLASLPNRTVYTSQATPLLQTLHVTAPAAAEIGDVTLSAKTSAALRSALDTAGGLQSRGATIAFPAKAFTGLKPGNYTVILDIIPVNAASDSKPTQAKFTLTVKK